MANQNQNQNPSANLPAVISTFLSESRPMLAQYANKSCAMGPFLRSAMLAIINDKKLIEAIKTDKGKASLLGALQHAAITGLSLNPSEGKACLIPYGDKVQYLIMKNGRIEQAMNTGKVKYIMGDVIRERDTARIVKTMNGDIVEHEIGLDERGKIRGFYAAMMLSDGEQHVTYMTTKEVEEHRDKYAKGLLWTYDDKYSDAKKGDKKADHAWHKSFEGQGIKTVIRRLLSRVAIAEESSVDEMNKFDEMTAEAKPDPTAPPTDIKDRFEAATEETASQTASQEQPKKDDLPLAGKSSTADPQPQEAEEQKVEEYPTQKTPPLAEEPVPAASTGGSATRPEESEDTGGATQNEMDIF